MQCNNIIEAQEDILQCMHMNNDKNDEIEICQFWVLLSYQRKHRVCVQSMFQWMGKIILCTYLHRASTFSIMTFSRMVPPT